MFSALALGRLGLAEFAFYATYTQNFYIAFVSHRWGAITHFWTLAIEEQFYLLAAPILIFSPSSQQEKKVSVSRT